MSPLLDIDDLHVSFRAGPPWRKRDVPVVRGVSLRVAPGEIVGLIGESGSGKSTIARAVVGLAPVSAGRITLGDDVARRSRARHVQMIFQDPVASLDPKMTVGAQIAEPLAIHGIVPARERRRRVMTLLGRVGLPESAYDRMPHMFSGGQRARIGIARALAVEPQLLIADEATAALDISVQAQILNLLMDLRDDLGLSLLFITHDLAVVRVLCDRGIVLQGGRIVEEGAPETLLEAPRHPYTRALFAAHISKAAWA